MFLFKDTFFFLQIIFGHHKLLMGLAVHPDDEMFATAGNDKNIALWKGHKPIFVTQVNYDKLDF